MNNNRNNRFFSTCPPGHGGFPLLLALLVACAQPLEAPHLGEQEAMLGFQLGSAYDPSDVGVTGDGLNAAPGVLGRGGPNQGTGVEGLAGTNGTGVLGWGNGIGSGVAGVTGESAAGVYGYGGWGVYGVGIGHSGAGVVGQGAGTGAGGRFAAGTTATATVRQVAISAINGDISLQGVANPAPSTPVANTITPTSIVKAWASVQTDGGGSPFAALLSGMNVRSVIASAGDLEVVLAEPVAADCAASATPQDRLMACAVRCEGWRLTVQCSDLSGSVPTRHHFSGGPPVKLSVSVLGAQ